MRKLLSLILTLSLILSMVPGVFAEEPNRGGNGEVSWVLSEDGTLTVTGSGPIPDYDEWDNWYYYYHRPSPWAADSVHYGIDHDIKRVVVGEGITALGERFLHWCDTVESISLPSTLTEIRDDAFSLCSKLKDVSIPPSVKRIGNGALGHGITELTLPSGVELADGAFDDAYDLVVVNVAEDDPNYCTKDGMLLSKDGKTLLFVPRSQVGSHFEVPEGIERLGAYLFKNCSGLTSVTLPEGLVEIGSWAFYFIGLTEIELPSTLKTIGDSAFKDNEFTTLTLPEGLETIGKDSFAFCKQLAEINAGHLKNIGDYAFRWTALTSADISGAETLGRGIFTNCDRLESVKLPDALTELPEYIFDRCTNLTELSLPEGVTSIGRGAFSGCTSLPQPDFPKNLRVIGERAFDGCWKLGEPELPEGLESIGAAAFQFCTFKSVTLPSTLKTLDNLVFAGSSELTEIVFLGDAPSRGDERDYDRVLDNRPTLTVYYPEGSDYSSMRRQYPLINWVAGTPKEKVYAEPTPIHALVADFDVYMEGNRLEHRDTSYPLLVYKGVTYFPMTYDSVHRLGLTSSWMDGVFYLAHCPNARYEQISAPSWRKAVDSIDGETVSYPIYLNGRLLVEQGEYPVFNARGITYFPLTWDYATKELGLEIQWRDGALYIDRLPLNLNVSPYEIADGKVYFTPERRPDGMDVFVFDPEAKTVERSDHVISEVDNKGFSLENEYSLTYNGETVKEYDIVDSPYIRNAVITDTEPFVCIKRFGNFGGFYYETFMLRNGELRTLQTAAYGNMELLGEIEGRPVVKATWKSEREAVSAVNDGYFIVDYDPGYPSGSLRKIYPYVFSNGAFTVNDHLYLIINRNSSILDVTTGEEILY